MSKLATLLTLHYKTCQVGDLQLPPSLWRAMKTSPRVEVTLPIAVRVERILHEYDYWVRLCRVC